MNAGTLQYAELPPRSALRVFTDGEGATIVEISRPSIWRLSWPTLAWFVGVWAALAIVILTVASFSLGVSPWRLLARILTNWQPFVRQLRPSVGPIFSSTWYYFAGFLLLMLLFGRKEVRLRITPDAVHADDKVWFHRSTGTMQRTEISEILTRGNSVVLDTRTLALRVIATRSKVDAHWLANRLRSTLNATASL